MIIHDSSFHKSTNIHKIKFKKRYVAEIDTELLNFVCVSPDVLKFL